MNRLKTYTVGFRISTGVTYKTFKARDEEDLIRRIKQKNYRTDIILSINEEVGD